MGVSHATTGAAAGLWLAAVFPAELATTSWVGQLVFAAVAGGFALLPDLDHPQSTATRRFGPASMLASAVVRPLSAVVFRLTAMPSERGRAGSHRHLTHTVAAAAGLGWAVNTAVGAWGEVAVWVVLFVGLALAVKGIDHLIPGPPSLAAAGALTALVVVAGGDAAPWLGWAVTVGMLVHSVGDSLTSSGAPLLWPVPVRGRVWAPVRPPGWARFRTGGPVEWVVLAGATVVVVWLGAAVVPGGVEARSAVVGWLTG